MEHQEMIFNALTEFIVMITDYVKQINEYMEIVIADPSKDEEIAAKIDELNKKAYSDIDVKTASLIAIAKDDNTTDEERELINETITKTLHQIHQFVGGNTNE